MRPYLKKKKYKTPKIIKPHQSKQKPTKSKQTPNNKTNKQKQEMITWITNSGNLKPGYAKDRSSNDTAIISFQLLKLRVSVHPAKLQCKADKKNTPKGL